MLWFNHLLQRCNLKTSPIFTQQRKLQVQQTDYSSLLTYQYSLNCSSLLGSQGLALISRNWVTALYIGYLLHFQLSLKRQRISFVALSQINDVLRTSALFQVNDFLTWRIYRSSYEKGTYSYKLEHVSSKAKCKLYKVKLNTNH